MNLWGNREKKGEEKRGARLVGFIAFSGAAIVARPPVVRRTETKGRHARPTKLSPVCKSASSNKTAFIASAHYCYNCYYYHYTAFRT